MLGNNMNINYLVRKVKLVILLFLLVQQGLHAQYQNINFEHVSSENNLFHFSINSILQDKTGFLWFGTRTGLNLYDGRKYIVYKTTNSDSSISNELIRVIYETKDGTLWIGTEKGLNKYDRDKRIFLRYINNPKNQESICDDKINGMVEDKNGNLWIATSNGLSKYDKKSDKFINYYSLPDNPNSIQSNMVSAIAIDNDGNLLLGLSTLGLDYVNLSKNHENGISKTLDIRHFSIKRASSSSVYISKILLDINNKIWIGTYGLGLFSVDKSAFSNLKGKNIVQDLNVTAYQGNKIGSKNISNNMVTDIIEDNNGNLWIGTFGGGVNIYYKNRNEFEYFKYDNKNGSSINSDYIKSLFIDRSNNIWIGTYTGGLNKYSPNQNKFKVYRNIPGDKSSLKSNLITSIFQDKKGILWIGTRTGLNRLDREKDQCDLYVYGSKESINDPCNLIRSSCEDNNNKLWVGSHDGLHCFDIIKKKYILKYNEPLQKLLLKNIIRTIILDDENNLWIGASGCLVKYNLSTNQFKKYIHIPNDPTSLNHNYVWSLYKDQFGNIWIGTREGLHKYNKDGDNFTRYILKTSPKLMYQENFISSICSDNHGIIWLGTFTGGIHRLTPHFKSDSKIPAYEQDSLSHFNISGSNEASIGGILIDKSQNLWAGSDNGILMLNNNRNISRLYDIRDRVASNELNTGSFFGSPTGEIGRAHV
jgi:ligand-binding sensor domain-containing protein